jgi:hypothetical protein
MYNYPSQLFVWWSNYVFKITLSNLHLSMYYYYYILSALNPIFYINFILVLYIIFLLFILYLYPYIFDLFYILWPFVVPLVDYTNMKINEMKYLSSKFSKSFYVIHLLRYNEFIYCKEYLFCTFSFPFEVLFNLFGVVNSEVKVFPN